MISKSFIDKIEITTARIQLIHAFLSLPIGGSVVYISSLTSIRLTTSNADKIIFLLNFER